MKKNIAVVIPCFRVKRHIKDVLAQIGSEVSFIYVVDDCCPEKTGDFVEENITDPRINVLRNPVNLGVGGAVIAGYQQAVSDGASIIVKIDGDGQMNPAILPRFIAPILKGQADYTKGNRFYDLTYIGRMPAVRLVGNAALSFITKISTGYWNIFDPTNGYTAISASVVRHLPMDKISNRYFFETDMLFRLNTLRAVVVDIPMDAIYGDEKSNLKVFNVIFEFSLRHFINFSKRIFYSYFLRDMTLASIELVIGSLLLIYGVLFGGWHWIKALMEHSATPLGTIMLSVLPILVGLQLLLAFIGFDVSNLPRRSIHDDLP